MSGVVLDTWAVMAMLRDEPAAQIVEDLLHSQREVVMSWINMGEVAYITQRRTDEQTALDTVRDLVHVIRDVKMPSRSIVLVAANLKAQHPMSYADAFAAATALTLHGELWTGDPELLLTGSPWAWRDLRDPTGNSWNRPGTP